MRIGSSIGLIAIGLIPALAVRVDLGGIDLELIGWILTVVGVVGLVASLPMARRSRTALTTRDEVHPPQPSRDPRYRAPPHRVASQRRASA